MKLFLFPAGHIGDDGWQRFWYVPVHRKHDKPPGLGVVPLGSPTRCSLQDLIQRWRSDSHCIQFVLQTWRIWLSPCLLMKGHGRHVWLCTLVSFKCLQSPGFFQSQSWVRRHGRNILCVVDWCSIVSHCVRSTCLAHASCCAHLHWHGTPDKSYYFLGVFYNLIYW